MNSAQPSDTYADRLERVDPRIPLMLFSGPEGEGKWKLIERVSAESASAGKPCALVFTSRASWMRFWSGGTLLCEGIARSRSGTICCYAGGDIAHAFYQLHLRKLGLVSPKLLYDSVLVALGDNLDAGGFVALVQNNDRLDVTYRIAKVAGVIDCGHCTRVLAEAQSQYLGEADTLVLTNIEHRNNSDVATACNILASVNPLATILHADSSSLLMHSSWKVSLGDFNEIAGQRLASETGMVRLCGTSATPVCFVSNLYNEAGTNTGDSASAMRAMRVIIPGDLDLAAFTQVAGRLMQALGAGLLRMSALLNVRHADYPVSFEIVGGSLIQPAYGSDLHQDISDICIIAKGLCVRETLQALGQCAWRASINDARLEAAI